MSCLKIFKIFCLSVTAAFLTYTLKPSEWAFLKFNLNSHFSLLRNHSWQTGGEPPGLSLTSFIFHFSLELQKFRLLMKGQIDVSLPSDCYRSCNTHPTAPSYLGRLLRDLWSSKVLPHTFPVVVSDEKKIELGIEVQIL